MANRFLDTNYYKSPFVRGLKGALKSLYSFIICDCNGSGVWNLDLQAASLYTGFEQTMEDFENHFVNTVKAIHLGGNKYFFPDFIEHQYPMGLNDKNPAHKNFISTLKKFDVLNDDLTVKNKAALEELHRPIGNGLLLGNGQGSGNVIRGDVFFNAEIEVLKNPIELERICMAASKKIDDCKLSLRKYHLFLEEKEQYPKTKKAIFAGFEKWLLNEKSQINGSGTHQQVPPGGNKLGTSEARIDKAKNW